MGKFKFEIKEGKFSFDVDTNEDGESVVKGSLSLSEAVEEAISRGEPIEGAKVVSFGFENAKLVLSIDTDKDGEKLFDLEIDLVEAFDEIKDAVLPS